MTVENRTNIEFTSSLLKQRLLRRIPKPGSYPTEIKDLIISSQDEPNKIENCFYEPVIGIVVQGAKCSIIGNEEYRYGEKQCLVVGVDLPSLSHITDASPEKPFLAISLKLDRYLATQLLAEIPTAYKPTKNSPKGASVGYVDPNILDAFLRLTELLDNPKQIPVLAPMIIREIHYRILTGDQGECIRMICNHLTQSNQIARAITWLRSHYKEPLQIDSLAQVAKMAASTFHRHFKQVTTLSPLQFQKRLRLYEAQRLMLTNDMDAGIAALSVGYESTTQFNREYKRLFGEPPRRDINRLQLSEEQLAFSG